MLNLSHGEPELPANSTLAPPVSEDAPERVSLLLRLALSAGKVVLILQAETAAQTIRDNPAILDSADVVLLQTKDRLSTMRINLEGKA